MNMNLRRVMKWGGAVVLFILLFILITNFWVVLTTRGRVLHHAEELDGKGVALVLGTSHRLINGQPNPFFYNRMQTAAQLFFENKIAHFLLSGDNRTKYYNEPQEMKKMLISLGVPDSVITLDYAGLRTLDSIVRSKEIFGQDKIIIVTQSFHCYRALFISKYYDIDAVALAAEEPQPEEAFKVYLREYLARSKAILDLYVLKTPPRHMGEKEPLNL